VPVILIRALPQQDADPGAVSAAVANAVATALVEDPRGTWVTWETVDAYAEGGVTLGRQPPDTHPPIVTVRAAGRPPEVVARMLRAIGDTLARELGLEPGNVFITFDEVDRASLYDASG
jgi:phenylpyruvate tautomerase PptA (4-oxalocrotonate tautomerase family)